MLVSHVELGSTRACSRKERGFYSAHVTGIAAVGVVVHRQFRMYEIDTLGDLIDEADRRLRVPAALITVIRSCLLQKHETPRMTETKTVFGELELLHSLVLKRDTTAESHAIAIDSKGQPRVKVSGDNVGSVAISERPRNRINHVVFAPFDHEYPPTEVVEARTSPGLQLLIAPTGLYETVATVEEFRDLTLQTIA